MDATGTRRGIAGAPTATEQPAPATRATSQLVQHSTGLTPRGITSVTGDLRTVRPGASPVQILPSDSTQEPAAGGSSTAGVPALFAEISDIVAGVQTAANDANALKLAAERANKTAAAYIKEAQEWVSKAAGHAAKGRSAEAEQAMAKAQEAWSMASAQQAFADRAASDARTATARAEAALANARSVLDDLAAQGLSRTALLSPTTLVDQAARLTTAAGKAAAAAQTAANAVGTTLAGGSDPAEVAAVMQLIAGAQTDLVNAQKAATASTGGSRAATSAAKGANSKVAFVQNALDSGGTEAAEPHMEQLTKFRDTAVTGAADGRKYAAEAQQLATTGAAKATAAFEAAKALEAQFAALGKTNPFVTALVKAAQQAKDAATKAQRSAAIADKAAGDGEEAATKAQASLDDANARIQRYLDGLEAANNPPYTGGGY